MGATAETTKLETNEFTNYSEPKEGTKSRGFLKKSKKNKAAKNQNPASDVPLLPYDFDSAVYLEINTDVAEAGTEAAVHYVYQGIKEGRAYRYPRPDEADA